MGAHHMRPYTHGVRRTFLAGIAVTVAVVACGEASAPAAPVSQTLTGSGFTARFGASWTKTTRTSQGATEYELSSHGSLSAAGLPAAGAIGISVQVVPFSVLQASGAPDPSTLTQVQLMDGVVGTPTGATGVTVIVGLHSVTFAGDTAAAASLTYTSGGVPNLQEDVVDRHAKVVYLVELDAEPSLKVQAEAAVNALVKSWSWTA